MHDKPLRSFFDFIKNGFSDFTDNLERIKKEIEEGGPNFLKEWVLDNESLIRAATSDTQKMELRKSWKKNLAGTGVMNRWLKKRDDEFNKWVNNLNGTYLFERPLPAFYIHNKDYGLFKDVIKEWFKKKIETMKPKLPDLEKILDGSSSLGIENRRNKKNIEDILSFVKTKEEKKAETKKRRKVDSLFSGFAMMYDVKYLGTLIQSLFEEYCKTFFEALGDKNPLSSVKLYRKDDGAVGYFSSGLKTIKMDAKYLDFVALIKFLSLIYEYRESDPINKITQHPTYVEYFAPQKGEAVTILHELEHARRDHIQDEGKHAPHTQGVDAYGRRAHFNPCTNSYGEKAFANGHVEKWIQKLKTNYLHHFKDFFEAIQKSSIFFYYLEKIQKKDKNTLIKKMGIIEG